MNRSNVYLKKLTEADKNEFKKKIQESFNVALSENFKNAPVVPSDKELENAFNAPEDDVYCIYLEGEKVGGAVVRINNETQINALELFFIYKGKHSSGLGIAAWKAVEKQYPETKVWETVTPYFEKRNINFYVNKCGFHIVEFCNKYHRNKKYENDAESDIPGTEDFFVFQKVMNN